MRSKTNLVSSLLLLAIASSSSAQVSITATTDTTIRKNWPNDSRATNGLEVRSFDAPRQQIAYIRFDLRELDASPATGATFTVKRPAGGNSTSATQLEIYGLNNNFNNTPQGWVDTGLTYNTSGAEIPWDGISNGRDLDLTRVTLLGNFPASGTAGDTLTLTGTALDNFLSDRYASGGAATLMVVETNNSNRIVTLFNTESVDALAVPPTLTFPSGTLQALPADTLPPTVAGASPDIAETDVLINTTVRTRFSEPMDALTVDATTVYLEGPGATPVATTFTYNAATLIATLTPDANLALGTTYTVTIVGGPSGVTDVAGNPQASDFTWSFTTLSDSVPPTVVSVNPADTQTDVAYDSSITVVFDEDVDPATINGTNFYLLDGNSNRVPAGVSYDALTLTATLNPLPLLKPGTTYTVTVAGEEGGVSDIAANPMAADFVSTFTTLAYDPTAPVALHPVADTHVRYGANQANNYGTSQQLDTRQNDTAPRDFFAYIRFDLGSIPGAITDATFTLTVAGGDALVPGRIRIVGLDNVAGNTPQNWSETALSFNTAGSEVAPALIYDPGPPAAGDSPFDFTRVTDFEEGTADIVETAGGNSGSITGPALATWLESRRKDGGLVTFLVDFPAQASDKSVNYASKENLILNPPRLDIGFEFIPTITHIEYLPAGPSIKLTWTGVDTQSYDVERTDTGLESPDWQPVVRGLSGAAVNTYTDSTLSSPAAFYRVVSGPPLPTFFDDFDGTPLAWTADSDGSTAWELGTPTSGPGAAKSGANCYGTNLGADYSSDADVSLISPPIDLTGAADTVLSFDHFFDVEGSGFDYCEVYVRDGNGAEIAALAAPLATYDSFTADWEPVSLPLPVEAHGMAITIEFRLVSDSSSEFPGWYIDNVGVATP